MIAWAHSSFSSDSVNCVEAGRGSVVWSRPSRCAGGDCLEAVRTSGAHTGVLVRDSKEGAAGFRIQMWPPLEWADLLVAVRLRQQHPAVDRLDDGSVLLGLETLNDRHEILHYSETEWTAFELGAIAGEFEHSVLPDVGEWSRPSACRCNKLSGPVSVGVDGAGRSVEPSGERLDQAAAGADVTVPDTAPVAADSEDSPAGRPVDASSGVKTSVVADRPGSSEADENREDLLIKWTEDPTLGEPQDPGVDKGAARRAGQGPGFADRSSVEAAGTGALPPVLVPVAEPRVWVISDQPGREVTHVRDDEGDLWERCPADSGEEYDRWLCEGDADFVLVWHQLLNTYGPLTDATPAPLVPTDGAS